MGKEYSLKTVVFSRFPACYEALSKTIKFDKLEIRIKPHAEMLEIDPVDALKELGPNDLPITINFFRNGSSISVSFSIFWTIFEVNIEGVENTKSDELYKLIEDSLRLTEPTEEDYRGRASIPFINDLLWKVHDKVETIEKRFEELEMQPKSKMRCFVSFRFDDHSKALAFEVREFLELIGIDFISGLGYEPRSISEKVVERLTDPLDLFIVIQSSSGDSVWLNQEIGVARGRNLPILVLKEEGADVDLGLLGDTEYLSFPENNISKAFVGILQAISYLGERSKKT